MSKTLWKWFEGEVGAKLKEIGTRHPVRALRLQDTAAARVQYLPAQAGDYIVACPRGGVLLEVKSSTVHGSLTSGLSSLMEKRQAAEHRLWHRAGQPSLVVFYSSTSEEVEVWDGAYVAPLRAKGGRLSKDRASSGPLILLTQLLKAALEV